MVSKRADQERRPAPVATWSRTLAIKRHALHSDGEGAVVRWQESGDAEEPTQRLADDFAGGRVLGVGARTDGGA